MKQTAIAGLGAFRMSIDAATPPGGLDSSLRALWWMAKGDWNKAHAEVDHEDGADAAWVHAYLHRVEGDLANARYWYLRAGKPVSSASLEDEWTEIAADLTGKP
jgi:hypothetical protein